MTITVNTAVITVREALNEVTAGAWTDTQIKRWINEGIRDVARRTNCLRDSALIDTLVGVGEYTIPSNVLRIYHAYYLPLGGDTREIPLIPGVYESLDSVWAWNPTSQSEPRVFTTWGTPPLLKLKIYPTPANSTGDIKLMVSRLPTEIVAAEGSDTSVIDMPEGWTELAFQYAEYRAFRKDKQYEASKYAFAQYEAQVLQMGEMALEYLAVNDHVMSDVGGYGLPLWLTHDVGDWG